MKAFVRGDRVVYTGEGARAGLSAWHGYPPLGTRGVVERVLPNAERAELAVVWEQHDRRGRPILDAFPVMGADVARIGGAA